MKQQYAVFTFDAFTERPYAGNPCAVVVDAEGLADQEMQLIAREMNLSETAFVLPTTRAAFRVRYFTPRVELPFAGHPTIATAAALTETGRITLQGSRVTIDIEFGIGVLPVTISLNESGVKHVVMEQPVPVFGESAPGSAAASALGLDSEDLHSTSRPQVAGVGVPFMMIGVRDVEALSGIRPDWQAMKALCERASANAVYAYAPVRSGSQADLCARFLDPFSRYEDPFTGSACGAMAVLAYQDGMVTSKEVVVEQGRAVGRVGYATVDLHDVENRILVGGSGVCVLSGTITRPFT